MILSNKEASSAHRMHIRDNLQARVALGCDSFQNEIRRGIHAISTSPDGHCIAIMTLDFAILVHDKIKERTASI